MLTSQEYPAAGRYNRVPKASRCSSGLEACSLIVSLNLNVLRNLVLLLGRRQAQAQMDIELDAQPGSVELEVARSLLVLSERPTCFVRTLQTSRQMLVAEFDRSPADRSSSLESLAARQYMVPSQGTLPLREQSETVGE